MARQQLNSATQLSPNETNARRDFTSTLGQVVYNISPSTFEVLSLEVFVAGELQRNVVDYTINSPSQITLQVPTSAGVEVTLAWKNPSQGAASPYAALPVREDFVATAGQTTFSVGQAFEVGQEFVLLNGRAMRYGATYDYTVSGNAIVFNTGLGLDDKVTIVVVANLTVGGVPLSLAFVPTTGQTDFPIPSFVLGQERVYVNGSRKLYGLGKDYTVVAAPPYSVVTMAVPLNPSDSLVVDVLNGVPTVTTVYQQWVPVRVTYSEVAAASGGTAITVVDIFSLPPGYVFHGVMITHTVAFRGGTLVGVQAMMDRPGGIPDTGNFFPAGYVMNTVPSGGSFAGGTRAAGLFGPYSLSNPTVFQLMVLANDDLTLLTQGECEVRFLVSQGF